MWGKLLFVLPFFLWVVAAFSLFFLNNQEILGFNLYSNYRTPTKTTKHTSSPVVFTRVYGYIIMWYLLHFAFWPLHYSNNFFFFFHPLQYKLLYCGLGFYVWLLRLYGKTSSGVLFHNEFFLSLWIFLPLLYVVLISCSDLLVVYIIVEVFSTWTLIILYSTHAYQIKQKLRRTSKLFTSNFYLFLLYQFLLNFIASFVFCSFLIIIIQQYGLLRFHNIINITTTNILTYTLNDSNDFGASFFGVYSLFFLFILTKFGLGPWFQYKLKIYDLLKFELLLFYLFLYGVVLLPFGLSLIYLLFVFHGVIYVFLMVFFIGSSIWILMNLYKFFTLNQVLGGSSLVFYLFSITQIIYCI